jgi:Sulfotransferase family
VGKEKDLLPASDANPQGFWEHMAVVDINKAILNSIGLDWVSADQFDLKKIRPAQKKNLSAQIKEIVKNFNRHEVWAIKDPRFCITLPLWKKNLPNALIIVCVRHPMEIAKSLEKRNGIPLSVGCALWESYTRALIENCAGMEYLVVSYPELIDTPQIETKRIVTWLQNHNVPGISPISAQMLQKISNPRLYRQHFNEKENTNILTEDQQTLFAAFRKRTVPLPTKIQEGSRLSQDLIELFNINRKLSKKLKDTFSDPEEGVNSSAISTSDKEISFFQLEKMIKENESAMAKQLTHRKEQKTRILQLKEIINKKDIIRTNLTDKIQEKSGRVAQLKEILEGNQITISEQATQLQELKENLTELNKELNTARADIENHLKSIKDQTARIAQLKSAEIEKDATLEQQSTQNQEFLREIQRLEKAAEENQATNAQQSAHVEKQAKRINEFEETTKKNEAAITRQSKHIQEQESTIAQFEGIIKKSGDEIEYLRAELGELQQQMNETRDLITQLDKEVVNPFGIFIFGNKMAKNILALIKKKFASSTKFS